MPNLTEFLLARIAEDEAAAHHARGLLGMDAQWHTAEHLRERGLTIADARHVERWSSARVLAECEAKRRIVELHDCVHECIGDGNLTADPNLQDGAYGGPCDTLLLLALPYADHPDYRDEWRP